MSSIMLEKDGQIPEKSLDSEYIIEVGAEENDGQEGPVSPEDVAREGLHKVANTTRQLKQKFTSIAGESKKSGGGSVWWFSPCGEHSVARYVCCTGGRCESWKKD